MKLHPRLWALVLIFPVLTLASSWNNQSYFCSKGNHFERKVELEYLSPGNPVPCETRFYRDIEGFKVPHLLVHAEHETGKCEQKQSAYLKKMKGWGVKCQLVETREHLASTEPTTPTVPASRTLASETPSFYKLGASLGASFGMGRLGTSEQRLPSRTMDAFALELLAGVQAKRFLIGVDLDLRFQRQLSSLANAGGSNLRGQSYLIGVGIGAPLHKKLLIQASVQFLGQYSLTAQSDQSHESSFKKPLGLRVKTQYLFDSSPFSADMELQYLRWTSIDSGSNSIDIATTQWMIGVGLTYHFNHEMKRGSL